MLVSTALPINQDILAAASKPNQEGLSGGAPCELTADHITVVARLYERRLSAILNNYCTKYTHSYDSYQLLPSCE